MVERFFDAAAEFGQLLLRYRQESGLTQEELAERSGMSVRAISDMERGRSRGPQQKSVQTLVDALGLSGEGLTRLLSAAQQGRTRKRTGHTGLCELPPGIPDLVGRSAERMWISGLQDAAANRSVNSATVGVITGQPGIGKTVLAINAGYELAHRFPGGVYFLDLRGADAQPMSSAAALDRLLRAAGLAESEIPDDLDERSSLLRAVTARKPVLLILDNAHDEAQVRPLLLHNSTSMQLITSRRTLSGLEAVRRLDLDVLPPEDAVLLLHRAAGQPASVSPGALEAAQLCGYLPLALRIAGNRLSVRRQLTPDGLAALLADRHRRLSVLAIGDRQVRAAFDVSYQQLSVPAKTLFRRLALAPQPEVGLGLGAAVSGLGHAQTVEAFDELCETSMIMPAQRDRFRLHDLLQLFARECLAAEETPEAAGRAEDAMCGWLVEQVAVAGQSLDPDRAEGAEALEWLAAEDGNWLPALKHEAAAGRHAAVARAVLALHWFSDMRARQYPWVELFSLGLASARADGDRASAAVLLSFVCWAQNYVVHEPEAAWRTYEEAIRELRAVGDRRNEAWTASYGASIKRLLGDLPAAEELARASLALFTEIGYALGVNATRGVVGTIVLLRGRPLEALELHREQLATFQSSRADRPWQVTCNLEAHSYWRIGDDLQALGSWKEALAVHEEMERLSREIDMLHMIGIALQRQGLDLIQLGRPAEAAVVLAESLEVMQDTTGDLRQVVETYVLLGQAELACGDAAAAQRRWTEGLDYSARLHRPERVADLVVELNLLLALMR